MRQESWEAITLWGKAACDLEVRAMQRPTSARSLPRPESSGCRQPFPGHTLLEGHTLLGGTRLSVYNVRADRWGGRGGLRYSSRSWGLPATFLVCISVHFAVKSFC